MVKLRLNANHLIAKNKNMCALYKFLEIYKNRVFTYINICQYFFKVQTK